jgi:anti-sigma B factor antagonist
LECACTAERTGEWSAPPYWQNNKSHRASPESSHRQGGISVSLTLNVRQAGGVSILDAAGRVTLGEAASALREKLREMVAGGSKNILLNLADASYIDSTGIGILVSSFATVKSSGGQMKLANLSSRVKDVLLVTKLYTVFEVFDNEAAAISSFKGAVQPAHA